MQNISKKINELIGQGYKFCITLDNTFNDIEKLENLKIFNIVISPKEIRQYNEISRKKKIYKNYKVRKKVVIIKKLLVR